VRVLDALRHGGAALLPVWADPNLEFEPGDMRDAAAVARAVAGVDAVVHLAAIVGDPACARDPATATSINRDAALALIDAAQSAGVRRFVFASTCSNYGRMADPNGMVDEASPLAPVSLYAETKVAVEGALLAGPPGDMLRTVLRLATVYGVSPRMRFDLTVNEFTAEMVLRRRLCVFGQQFWRPYVHVADVGRAITRVLTSRPELVERQVYNVGGSDQNFRKQDLVGLIHPLVPDAVVEYVHRDEDPRDYRVSFERIRGRLGFSLTRSVPDGIAEVARLVGSGVVTDIANPVYRN
jgi:nucleoside-diphosphate-sugar epimerase